MKKSKIIFTIIFSIILNFSSKAQGPVIVVGIDTETGIRPGNNSHGTIATWCNLINQILANVQNGQQDIAVICSKDKGNVTSFWNQIGNCVGRNIDYKHKKKQIKKVNFEDYALIAVVSDHKDISGRLKKKELKKLNKRKDDIAKFLCNGGGVFASSCELSNPYDYLEKFGTISINHQSYGDITPTAEGNTIGITNTNLDGGPWHITFTSFPPHLRPLATITNATNVASIGGVATGQQSEAKFTLPKSTFCEGEEIVADPTSSINASNHFWSVQESDANWNRFGPEITQWFNGAPTIRNITNFASSHSFTFKCNTYYRIKLAVSGICTQWHETTQLVKISCPKADAGNDICCSDPSASKVIGTTPQDPNLSYSWNPQLGLNSPFSSSSSVNCDDISDFEHFIYTLTVLDKDKCQDTDEVAAFFGKPLVEILEEKVGCCGYKLKIRGQGIADIQWSTGATDVTEIDITQAGTYSVTVSNACGSTTKSINVQNTFPSAFFDDFPDILAPNAFTPNGDGVNDVFEVYHYGTNAPPIHQGPYAYNATEYELTIWDGGGQPHVFTGTTCTGFKNGDVRWDGKINGQLVQIGVYPWTLRFKNCRIKNWTPPGRRYDADNPTCIDCGFGFANYCGKQWKRCKEWSNYSPFIKGHVTVVR